jgi:hypothetical protein
MFNRDNAVGFVMLGLCAVVAGVMVFYIITGDRPTLDLPPVLSGIVGILFFGLIIFGFIRSPLFQRLRGGQGGKQWPDPGTGQKSLWDRLRGK